MAVLVAKKKQLKPVPCSSAPSCCQSSICHILNFWISMKNCLLLSAKYIAVIQLIVFKICLMLRLWKH